MSDDLFPPIDPALLLKIMKCRMSQGKRRSRRPLRLRLARRLNPVRTRARS